MTTGGDKFKVIFGIAKVNRFALDGRSENGDAFGQVSLDFSAKLIGVLPKELC